MQEEDDEESLIEEEIRKNVLEHFNDTEQAQDLKQRAHDNLEALEEVTGLSELEIQQIALQTRETFKQNTIRRHKLIIAGLSATCLIIMIATLLWFKPFSEPEIPVKYRVTISTGINDRNQPSNALDKISLRDKKIYFFTKFSDLKQGATYNFSCKMLDGAGNIVFDRDTKPFTPKGRTYRKWCWYKLNPLLDQIGQWKVIGFLNGEKVIEKNIEVIN